MKFSFELASCAHPYTKHTPTVCSRCLTASRYYCIGPRPRGMSSVMFQSMGPCGSFFLQTVRLWFYFISRFQFLSYLHQRLSSTLDSKGSCSLAAILSTGAPCATCWPHSSWSRCFSLTTFTVGDPGTSRNQGQNIRTQFTTVTLSATDANVRFKRLLMQKRQGAPST
ncbi:hypothetical protein P692DRAFT_20279327 [Suillus brevipes Sb2]|nr:hypothetical protein P692DRAFT_20279327 [Suillus brevipes Sb2]